MYALILITIHIARHDRRGVTAIEYAVIASMIAVVIIGAITSVGVKVKTLFTSVGAAI
jgi:pilus assembly protein Flp/PilA